VTATSSPDTPATSVASTPTDAVVERWLRWWHTGDAAIADELYTSDYQRHATDTGTARVDVLKGLVAAYLRAFPDLHFAVEDTLTRDDRVAVRWTATGTHRGEVLGLQATGRAVDLGGCDILRIRGDRIAESWSFYDRAALLAQLRD
jgi:steroid delta-isomerase-like uncharacterized protein